ncbi:MAG: GNAT family N-acetyltransferase [Anaerolineae bacterium]|nr:GNAT family N-acetyltransferase [Anaerolineae bacterium]
MRAPDVRLEGRRVTIRPLTRTDLHTMSKWPAFEDPLDRLFDWPKRSQASDDLWFYQLVHDRSRVYYAVDAKDAQLIGRISLRDISGKESARLGIGFGPQYVGHGYGTEALQVFLRHFFLDLGFERMVLDVAAVNVRAVRCYERCGFRRVGTHHQYAGGDEDLRFLSKPAYTHLRPFFQRDRYRNLVLAYDMELTREEWMAAQETA